MGSPQFPYFPAMFGDPRRGRPLAQAALDRPAYRVPPARVAPTPRSFAMHHGIARKALLGQRGKAPPRPGGIAELPQRHQHLHGLGFGNRRSAAEQAGDKIGHVVIAPLDLLSVALATDRPDREGVAAHPIENVGLVRAPLKFWHEPVCRPIWKISEEPVVIELAIRNMVDRIAGRELGDRRTIRICKAGHIVQGDNFTGSRPVPTRFKLKYCLSPICHDYVCNRLHQIGP